MSRSLRSRIPETVAPSTRVCVSINLSIYLSIIEFGAIPSVSFAKRYESSKICSPARALYSHDAPFCFSRSCPGFRLQSRDADATRGSCIAPQRVHRA